MANADAWNQGWAQGSRKQQTPSMAGPKKKESGLKKFLHIASPISNFDRGGLVKKTGVYKLTKGERVLTAKQAKMHGLGGKKKHAKKRYACKG